jgi:hypothetical protein
MIGLVGVFALGLITIAISLGRFLVYIVSAYSVDDASGSKCENIPLLSLIMHGSI